MQTAIWTIPVLAFGLTACSEPTPKPAEQPAKAMSPCDPALPKDCVRKGRAFQYGRGGDKDPTKARAALAHGCDGDNLNACLALGMLLVEAGEREAGQVAMDEACDGGYLFACVQAGNLYLGNQAVAKDYAKAKAYYERACQDMRKIDPQPDHLEFTNGQAYGCDNIGMLYENAFGVDRDRGKTFELARFACEHGWANGCNQVGVFIERQWAPQEYADEDALGWYLKACDMHYARGCCGAAIVLHERAATTEDGQDAAAFVELSRKLHWNCALPGDDQE